MGTYISPNGIGYSIKQLNLAELDLVEEASWEDHVEFADIDLVIQEQRKQPVFGLDNALSSGIHAYVDWWMDGEENTNCHG